MSAGDGRGGRIEAWGLTAPDASAKRVSLDLGMVIAGRYCVERRISDDHVGVLLEARDIELGTPVLLQVIADGLHDPDLSAKLVDQARNAARLESEYVARVVDVGMLPDGRPFVVLEHLEGEDLEQVIRRGKVEIETAVDWILDACNGLAAAHAIGLVHRDVRPSCLFLAKEASGDRKVKVMGFGLSRRALEVGGLGTALPDYTAPEVFVSGRGDARVDVWSLGAVLFELLTGLRPFAGDSTGTVARILAAAPPAPSAFRPEIPRALDEIVLRCLEKKPANRFASVAELAAALGRFGAVGATDLPVLSPYEPSGEAVLHRRLPDGRIEKADVEALRSRPAAVARQRPRSLRLVVVVSLAVLVASLGWLAIRNVLFPPKTDITMPTFASPSNTSAPPPTTSEPSSAASEISPEPVASPSRAAATKSPTPMTSQRVAPRPTRRPASAASARTEHKREGDPWGWRR